MTKRIWWGAVALVAVGCAKDGTTRTPMPMEVRTPLFAMSTRGDNLGTHLSGDNEVPVRETQGQGQAIFRISDDETSVDYKLIASNIDNVFMAHIHLGPVGTNGPIVVWLFPSTTPNVTAPLGGGRTDGVLAEGHFTAADMVGPLKGHAFSELLAAMRSSGAYVNVHTNDGVDGTNTGPGDFPGGEIRGWLATPGVH